MSGGQIHKLAKRQTCASDPSYQSIKVSTDHNFPPRSSIATDYSNPVPNTSVPPHTQYAGTSSGQYTGPSSGQYTSVPPHNQYVGPSSGQYTSQSTSSFSHPASDIDPPTGLPHFNVYNTDPNTDRPSGINDDLLFNMMSLLHQQPVCISSVNDQPTDSLPSSLSSYNHPTDLLSSSGPPTTIINSTSSTKEDHNIVIGHSQYTNITAQYKPQPTNSEATSVDETTTSVDETVVDMNVGLDNVSSCSNNISSPNLHGIFIKYMADINNSISVPIDYANRLCSAAIIDELLVRNISTTLGISAVEKTTQVSIAVSTKLKHELDPTNTFVTVCEILNGYAGTKEIAIKMMNEAGLADELFSPPCEQYINNESSVPSQVHALSTHPPPLLRAFSQEHALSKIVEDKPQLLNFLKEEDNAMKKYYTLNDKFKKLFKKARKAFQTIPDDELIDHICSLLSGSEKLTDAYYKEIDSSRHSIGSSTLLFLKKSGYLNVWNHEILSDIVNSLVENDKGLTDSLEEYRQEYNTFFEENLKDLERIFKREYVDNLQPQVPSNHMEFGFHLDNSWQLRSGQNWRDRCNNWFSWFKHTALTKIKKSSIILMYTALPCVVSSVIRDLTDPIIISELQSIGVTVILPTLDKEDTVDTVSSTIPVASEETESSQSRQRILQSSSKKRTKSTHHDGTRKSKGKKDSSLFEKASSSVDYKLELNSHLTLAVRSNNSIDVTRLLREGADPNQFLKDIPLTIAIKNDYTEIVSVLLDYGADITCTSPFGSRPLHVACEFGRAEIVELLITKGKAIKEHDINAKDKYGWTPLFYAVQKGHTEIVNILLTNGARTDVVDKNDNSLIDVACRSNNTDIVELLKEKLLPEKVAGNLDKK